MKNKLRYIALVLSFVAFGASVISYFFGKNDSNSTLNSSYITTVRERVLQELVISKQELTKVSDLLLKAPQYSFSNLSTVTKYPYYIFEGDSLIFWSDYRFVPDRNYIKDIKKNITAFVTFEDGSKYLISQKELLFSSKPTVRIYSLIDLYHYYKHENDYLQTGYNSTIFMEDPKQIAAQPKAPYQSVNNADNTFLFGLLAQKSDAFRNQSATSITLILGLLAMLLLGIFIYHYLNQLNRARRYEVGFLVLFVYLVVFRLGLLYFEIPHVFYDFDIFNPKYYGSSVYTPSLGDALLHTLVIVVLTVYVADYYYRSKTYYWLTKQSEKFKTLVSFLSVILGYSVFSLYFIILNSVYETLQFTLDITLSISFNPLKILCLVLFIFLSAIYFVITHLISNIFIRLNKKLLGAFLIFLAGSAVSFVLLWLSVRPTMWVYAVHGLYFWVLYHLRLPRFLYSFRYKTSIYLFIGAVFCAAFITYTIYHQEQQKDITFKKNFGEMVVSENNERTETLLRNANQTIEKDIEIVNNFLSIKDAAYTREQIKRKLKNVHLDRLLNEYDIDIVSFNPDGSALDNLADAQSLGYYQQQFDSVKYKTNSPSIFFINDVHNDFQKEYADIITVRSDSTTVVGYVLLNLKLRVQAESVYPELLKDERIVETPDTREYSYALFDARSQLQYSKGSYNYERKLGRNTIENTQMYVNGLVINNFKHVGYEGKNGRKVVVSSPAVGFKNVMSNFSFLFLILVVCVVMVIIAYAVRYGMSHLTVSYTTKIQILLNIAFFFPLLLVVLITLSVISANYATNQQNNYLSNTKNIATNFLPYVEAHLNGKSTIAYLNQELKKIAREANADIDINFFDTKGKLFCTTSPVMYESGLLSKCLNPKTIIKLLEEKDNEVLLDESLGQNQHRTAYVLLKSVGKPIGVLSIPYLDSKPAIERQMIEVLSSVLSIFAIMFLVFLVLSYWASNSLTVPLRLLTHRIRKTNLYQLNQAIEWKSDDEIGLMVGAYNQMLTKLEESKNELAKTEKLSAWQEMARQVAHEIKNPLTPMKLTIQQMQRTMSKDVPQNERIQRTMGSLLDQIDNISDIATSFSDFAKMPLPKNEIFEITSVLNKTADLYIDMNKLDLQRDIHPYEVYIKGDRQLMGRIITNLIINGIQSVPSERRPQILLRLYIQDSNVYIEVRDNGMGIAEAIRNKVFFPNFSTKRDGSGLGLAIAKRGVEYAGGNIWLDSEINKGTSFFISLPLSVYSS